MKSGIVSKFKLKINITEMTLRTGKLFQTVHSLQSFTLQFRLRFG